MRANEPRTTIRWSAVDFAMIEAAAKAAGVATGAFVREAALRSARGLAAEVAAPKLRRRSSALQEREVPVLDAVAPEGGRGKVSRPMVPASLPPGVKSAREIMLERQRKLNEGRG
jgi:uncharacterized protein (DUF1778 family)